MFDFKSENGTLIVNNRPVRNSAQREPAYTQTVALEDGEATFKKEETGEWSLLGLSDYDDKPDNTRRPLEQRLFPSAFDERAYLNRFRSA